jgi:hypothetical protein
VTRGRRRQVDISTHFCPNPACAYRGWVGWGNLRANGHPNGGPWRQLLCVACRGYFLETFGTLFHGKRVAVELIGRAIACLAEGLGIRGTARVFEVDPNTLLQWLVEATEQFKALGTRMTSPLSGRISVTGCSRLGAKREAQLPNRIGCRCPRCSMRTWSNRCGGDASSR